MSELNCFTVLRKVVLDFSKRQIHHLVLWALITFRYVHKVVDNNVDGRASMLRQIYNITVCVCVCAWHIFFPLATAKTNLSNP